MEEKFHDRCAVVGVIGAAEAANYCYLALYAMQHRGQEGSGIVSLEDGMLYAHREMGLVSDVFGAEELSELKGSAAIGHNRYATFGSKDRHNLQPLFANFPEGPVAIAHNGNLLNALEIRQQLEGEGAIFSTTSDTEVILHLAARARDSTSTVDRLQTALKQLNGSYSLVVLTPDRLIAIRDPFGVRPLTLGRIGTGYVVASETCAFDLIGASFVRDVEPGEILEIFADRELKSRIFLSQGCSAFCVFEQIYFARPDSRLRSRNVYEVRKQLGRELAREQPAEADLVIPVPDSGVPAAIGFAQEIELPLEFGLIRNHYVGRTFIEPRQSIRDFGVKIKLNPNPELLRGKRVVVVDDSVVRGTTCRKIVGLIRGAGAREVHFRISSPPTIGPCYYGIDTPSRGELIAATHSVEEIREFIDADTLGYLSVAGMYRAVEGTSDELCDACFTNNYRLGLPSSCSEGATNPPCTTITAREDTKGGCRRTLSVVGGKGDG